MRPTHKVLLALFLVFAVTPNTTFADMQLGLARIAFDGRETSPDMQPNGVLPVGVWQSAPYGYVVRVSATQVQSYDVSEAGCVRGPRYTRVAFRELYGIAEPMARPDSMTLHRLPTRDVVHRLSALPAPCRVPLAGASPLRNFDVFAATFAQYYPFFTERRLDWTAAVAQARTRVARGGADGDLFTVLRDLVQPLDDGHVSIDAGKRTFDPNSVIVPGAPVGDTLWNWRIVRTSLRDYLQGPSTPLLTAAVFAGNRRVLYGRLPGDIGYLAVLAEGGWRDGQTEDTPAAQHAAVAADVLDSIITTWGPLRGVVLDVRVNSGGFDAVALEVASRFTDTAVVVYRKSTGVGRAATVPYNVVVSPSARRRVQSPVAVLLSGNTVSAGETIALSFAAMPHARLFGQPTRGILSDAIPKVLPNGWSFTLSMEVTRLPDGTPVEARGVRPHEHTDAGPTADPSRWWGDDIRRAVAWLGGVR